MYLMYYPSLSTFQHLYYFSSMLTSCGTTVASRSKSENSLWWYVQGQSDIQVYHQKENLHDLQCIERMCTLKKITHQIG